MTQKKNSSINTWTEEENELLISLYKTKNNDRPLTYLEIARRWNDMYREGKVAFTKNEDSIIRQIKYLVVKGKVTPIDRSGNPHMPGKLYINRRGN